MNYKNTEIADMTEYLDAVVRVLRLESERLEQVAKLYDLKHQLGNKAEIEKNIANIQKSAQNLRTHADNIDEYLDNPPSYVLN